MKRIVPVVLLLLAGTAVDAKVTLPSIFGDNMVLQQKAEVAFWGHADGKKVTISAGWSRKKVIVSPDADGKWFVRIPTPEAGGPYEISFHDGEKCAFRNVLVGEVWFCCGQSNMVMALRGFGGQPVEHSADYIFSARHTVPIRLFDVPNKASLEPVEGFESEWKENRPEVVVRYSAVAYMFARKLHEMLQVPVGVITCDWGGTSVETWTPKDVFAREFEDIDIRIKDGEHPEENPYPKYPGLLYNGMISPIVPFTFKGILWYQGEDNRLHPEPYARFQAVFARSLRERFQNPDAPFYFVQIAPHDYDNPRSFASGYFYEAQQQSLALIPHSGMVTTVDIGEPHSIHPSKKQEVAHRLALLALVNDYGFSGVNPNPPLYKSVAFEGAEAVLRFETEWMSLNPSQTPVCGFEIAGEDRVFHPAVAIAGNKQVRVSSPDVSAPVAVRYCFRNWAKGSLFSAYGIPLAPFRTDSWDDLAE